jgi:hypothetical protein
MLQSTGCRIGLDPDRRTPITYSSGSLSAPRTAAALILGRSQTSSGLFFGGLSEFTAQKEFEA